MKKTIQIVSRPRNRYISNEQFTGVMTQINSSTDITIAHIPRDNCFVVYCKAPEDVLTMREHGNYTQRYTDICVYTNLDLEEVKARVWKAFDGELTELSN